MKKIYVTCIVPNIVIPPLKLLRIAKVVMVLYQFYQITSFSFDYPRAGLLAAITTRINNYSSETPHSILSKVGEIWGPVLYTNFKQFHTLLMLRYAHMYLL